MHLPLPILIKWRTKKVFCKSTKFFTNSIIRLEKSENCYKFLHCCETVHQNQLPRPPVLPTEDIFCVGEEEVSSNKTHKQNLFMSQQIKHYPEHILIKVP